MIVGDSEKLEDRILRHIKESVEDREGWATILEKRGKEDIELKKLCEFWIKTYDETIRILKESIGE